MSSPYPSVSGKQIQDKIRARVHKLITKKIAKHFDLDIRDDEFRFRIVEQEPAAEAVLNDICKRLESIRSDVKLGKHGVVSQFEIVLPDGARRRGGSLPFPYRSLRANRRPHPHVGITPKIGS